MFEQLDRAGETDSPTTESSGLYGGDNDPESGACAKKNCTASIQLQAMVAQLLGVQGLVACAVTRILLKSVPGSRVNESMDEVMDRAGRLFIRIF